MVVSSLADLSASNLIAEGHIFIVLKMYFDGSGKDDLRTKFLTLGGFASGEREWNYFDTEWAKILRDRGNPGYMHMTDAFAFRGQFKGWDLDKAIFLAYGLVGLLMEMPKNSFHGFRCTVDLPAYRYWQALNSLPSAPRVCSRFLFSKAYVWFSESPTRLLEKIDVIYDRDEDFLRHIDADWRNKKIRRRYPWWDLINTVAPANSKLTPALQAADMLAWAASRLKNGPRDKEIDELCGAILNGPATWNLDLDADTLQKKHGRIVLT
jgi:hypothetical protein